MGISYAKKRKQKGKSLLQRLDDYIVIDIETTGLDPDYCEIIELGALRISNGEIVDSFESLVKPDEPISSFIEELTGISNEMVAAAPSIDTAIRSFIKYLGDAILIGHNVNFDINFLYDYALSITGKGISNDFIDTLRLSRRILPELQNHRLITLIEHFSIHPDSFHRALSDCKSTYEIYEHLKTSADVQNIDIDTLTKLKTRSKNQSYVDARNILPTCDTVPTDGPFYDKVCVFTGMLEKMSRREAMQCVVNLGGSCSNGVTKKINYLILGNNDFCASIKDGKSNKQKKAEKYILEGLDIEIISENVFYDMLDSI